MTPTRIRPASRLSPLVAGIRTAVERHAGWAETSATSAASRLPATSTGVRNTADEAALSIHVYGTDVTRVGSSARRYYD